MGNVVNTIGIKDIYNSTFDDFAIPVLEDAPNTTIVNRAKVTRSLKAVAGIERIHCRSVNLLQNEFGPNGERVWELDSKDSRIRFVGGGWFANAPSAGTGPYTASTSDYVEVTFYGTGLNLLDQVDGIARSYGISVDGGSETLNALTGSNVLNNRNYAMNVCRSMTSLLTLGWHTVKIRNNAAGGLTAYGFEILNERTDLAVYSGDGISKGRKSSLSSLATSAFNAGVSGTKGARVLKYIYNNSLGTAVQEVDATAKYLTLADHTNEEVVRRINFREFGANRADDFSTLAGVVSTRAFTLDDGTTTLCGTNMAIQTPSNTEGVSANGSSFITITFVGTGLDVVLSSLSTSRSSGVFIDGTSVGSSTGHGTSLTLVKIASGLPYGTHIVKFNSDASFGQQAFSDFIIYQPKKPSIPEGALVVADYNLMANVSAAGIADIANGQGIISGMIWKPCMREFVYSGTWNVGGIASYQPKNGFITSSNINGNYLEYTFFGSSVAVELNGSSANTTCSIQIDGALNSSGVAYGVSVSNAGGGTYNILTPDASTAGIVLFTGLSYSSHTIRVTKTAAAGTLDFNGIFIGSQIHVNDSSLKIGSKFLDSITKYSAEKSIGSMGADLSKAKAWVLFDGPSNKVLKSYNVSAALVLSTGSVNIYFEKPFKDDKYTVSYTGDFAQGAIPTTGRKPSYCNVLTFNTTGSAGTALLSMVFHGELIDE